MTCLVLVLYSQQLQNSAFGLAKTWERGVEVTLTAVPDVATWTRVLFLTFFTMATAEEWWQQKLCSLSFPYHLTVNWKGACNTLGQGYCSPVLCILYLVYLLSGFFHRKMHTTHALLSVLYVLCSLQILRLKYMLIILWNLKFKPQKNDKSKEHFNSQY